MNNPYDQSVIKFLSSYHAEVNELKARDENFYFLRELDFKFQGLLTKRKNLDNFFPPCFGISHIEIQLPITVTKSFFKCFNILDTIIL